MNSSQFPASTELDARVTRFGLRVAAGLTERSAALPQDVSERLRFAREQALARAAQARAAASPALATDAAGAVHNGSTLALKGGPRGSGNGGNGALWAKLASALPLILLLAGLMLMREGQDNEQIAAAAEVDTALLSDSLPPAAFSDPGFAEFLRDGEE
ncbi:DUF3619 family protein [Roseateles sp. LYH14W]|uniref:DUF3619 family protein n=1 Tax=Pelomonas parva TaxID=3299032 RepID=A0ABW7F9E4_9BURK